jgi:hypothetical protein
LHWDQRVYVTTTSALAPPADLYQLGNR